MQSLSHSHKGAAGFSGACLEVRNSPGWLYAAISSDDSAMPVARLCRSPTGDESSLGGNQSASGQNLGSRFGRATTAIALLPGRAAYPHNSERNQNRLVSQ